MDWISKSRKLKKLLTSVQKPGRRLKIIRESKNRIGDFKDEFGFAKVAAKLAEMGAMKDDRGSRKILKRFENGEIKISHTKEPISSLIKLLDITPEFAGYGVEEEKEKEEAKKPKRAGALVSLGSKKSTFEGSTSKREYSVTLHNHIEHSGMNLQVKYYPELKEVVIELFGDMPVPQKMKHKGTVKCRSGEIWVPGLSYKYAESANPIAILGEANTKI